MKMIKIINYLIAIILLTSCAQDNSEREIQILLTLHEDQRIAHMDGNAKLLIEQMADSMYNIQDGEIYLTSKEDIEKRFTQYFASVRYKKWDDLRTPIIELAEDGTMATLIVDKIVEAASVTDDSIDEYSESYWSWMSAYRKEGGEWRLYSLASGRKSE